MLSAGVPLECHSPQVVLPLHRHVPVLGPAGVHDAGTKHRNHRQNTVRRKLCFSLVKTKQKENFLMIPESRSATNFSTAATEIRYFQSLSTTATLNPVQAMDFQIFGYRKSIAWTGF